MCKTSVLSKHSVVNSMVLTKSRLTQTHKSVSGLTCYPRKEPQKVQYIKNCIKNQDDFFEISLDFSCK